MPVQASHALDDPQIDALGGLPAEFGRSSVVADVPLRPVVGLRADPP